MQNKLIFIGMILVLGGLAIVQFSIKSNTQGESTPPDARYQTDDGAMQTAFDKARGRLDYFFDVAEKNPEGTKGFSLRVAVTQGDAAELFWVYPFEETSEGYLGRINDDPKIIDSVFKGEVIQFNHGQIVDWTFDDTQTNIMHGNYTGCVELQRAAPDHAAQFMELYGLSCDK